MKAYKPLDDPGWWRDVGGYGGKYQVSRHGVIRRVYNSGLVRDLTPFRRKNKITRNRLFVKLTIDGISKDVPVMQIVARAWLGKTPEGKVPYHINRDVTDNRADNIGFISKDELGKLTARMANKRIPVFAIDAEGNVLEVYGSAREAAKANYLSYQSVLDRCHKKVKNEYALTGFTFRFEEKPRKQVAKK